MEERAVETELVGDGVFVEREPERVRDVVAEEGSENWVDTTGFRDLSHSQARSVTCVASIGPVQVAALPPCARA